MKKTRILFLLLAGVLLLAGCQKEVKVGGKDAIRFTAESNPGTKTAYSGVYDNGRERINWVENDEIRIFSDKSEHRYHEGQHWADYVIKSVSNSGAVSKGIIDNVPGDGTGNGLIWNEAGDYKFFAIYPPTDCEDGHKGKFDLYLPNMQSIDITGRAPFTPAMKNAVLTAAQKITTTQAGEGPAIKMEFEPAYTTFEFTFDSDIPLEIKSVVLYREVPDDGSPAPLAGQYTVEYDDNLNVSYSTNSTTIVIPVTFSGENNPKVTPDNPFTFSVFALPIDITNLVVSLNVQGEGWDRPQARNLRLFYKSGDPVVFAGCLKHRIKATVQGSFNFKSITLNGEAVDWTEEEIDLESQETPQTSQFSVTGVQNVYQMHGQQDAYKDLRQTWVLGNATASVSFKVFSPKGGTYELKPYVKKADGTIVEGSTGFAVVGDLAGDIGIAGQDHVATKVSFTVTADGAADGDQLFFKTTVKDADGAIYNIDSETQLYDLRGYHYFMVNDPID